MEKVERRARVLSPGVDAEPAVVVPGVQDEGKTIVNLGYVELSLSTESNGHDGRLPLVCPFVQLRRKHPNRILS
jgi:hypothetical protein